MRETRDCEAALDRALALSPHDMADQFNLLLLFLDQHRMAEAGELLSRMTLIDRAGIFSSPVRAGTPCKPGMRPRPESIF